MVSNQPALDNRVWHALSAAERGACDAVHQRGFADGWQAADEHADRAHRAAYGVVQKMARYDSHEVAELKRENRHLRRQLERATAAPAPVDRLDLLPLHQAIKRENRSLHALVEELQHQVEQANARATPHERRGAAA